MSDWDDVARLALALPESSEGTSYGNRAWLVGKKAFVWDQTEGTGKEVAQLESWDEEPVRGLHHLALLDSSSLKTRTSPHSRT